MSWRARAAAVCAALLTGACAVVPPAPDGVSSDALSGRLAVRVDGDQVVALVGRPEEGAGILVVEADVRAFAEPEEAAADP